MLIYVIYIHDSKNIVIIFILFMLDLFYIEKQHNDITWIIFMLDHGYIQVLKN